MSDAIAPGKVAIIAYTLKNEVGEVVDRCASDDPFAYLHGAGNIVPGLENALVGKTAGETLSVSVPPEEAYGVPSEHPPQRAPREAFPADIEFHVGMQFGMQAEGGVIPVWVIAIDDEGVMLTGDHPMAGETLNFEVEVMGVRTATADEMAHGHPHGVDGTSGHDH